MWYIRVYYIFIFVLSVVMVPYGEVSDDANSTPLPPGLILLSMAPFLYIVGIPSHGTSNAIKIIKKFLPAGRK